MTISSINFQHVKVTSEYHNTRGQKLGYVDPELSPVANEQWILESIKERREKIQAFAIKEGGRKLRSDAHPIREAVVNLNENHNIDDLRKLADDLKEKHGIECFQIFIHRDEGVFVDDQGVTAVKRKDGVWRDMRNGEIVEDPRQDPELTWKCNNHAHMLFDVQHKHDHWVEKLYRKKKKKYNLKGKVRKALDMPYERIQTTVAESLGMERGVRNSTAEHLDAIEFKRVQEEKRVKQLQAEVEVLEQKKNQAASEYNEALREYRAAEEEYREAEKDFQNSPPKRRSLIKGYLDLAKELESNTSEIERLEVQIRDKAEPPR